MTSPDQPDLQAVAAAAPGTAGVAASGRSGHAARYESLDSLRGICALLVAAYHFNPAAYSLIGGFLSNAYLFVDFFFVLSGFVICHTYVDALGKRIGFADFVVRRIARLYPVHLAVVGAYLLMEFARMFAGTDLERAAFTGIRSLSSLVANLFLLQGVGLMDQLTWNGPSWSISSEFWTYLIFAAVVLHAGSIRRATFALLALAALAALAAGVPETMNVTVDLGFVRCIAGFFIGALVQQTFFAAGRPKLAYDRRGSTIIEIAVLAACVAFVVLAGDARGSLAAPLVFAVAVAVFARGGGLVSEVLQRSAPIWLGTISYSVYMLHAFVVYLINTVAKLAQPMIGVPLTAPFVEDGQSYVVFHLASPALMDIATVGFLAVIAVLAACSRRWIELPGARLINGWSRRASAHSGIAHDTTEDAAAASRP